MPELNAYREQRNHRHAWVTRVTRGLGAIELCACGAVRCPDLYRDALTGDR